MQQGYFLGEDERSFGDSLGKLFADNWSDAQRRKHAANDPGYSPILWKQLAELGALGAFLPESAGGSGGSGLSLMVVMEALGKACFPSPYLWTIAAAGPLLLAAGKQGLLGAIAAGQAFVTVALVEPRSRYDLNHVETSAERKGAGYVLNGRKSVVPFAAGAGRILVPARLGGGARDRQGIGLFLVDPAASGVTLQSFATSDNGRAADMILSSVAVASDDVVGEPGQALVLIERAVDLAILAQCAEAVGHMRTLLDATVSYAKTRQQFGVTLSSFQALQHRMVDMFAATETASARVQAALARVTGPDDPVDPRDAVLTKIAVDKSARLVGQEAVQLHGGMGMTDDLNVGHHFKRLTMMSLTFADQGKLMERYRAFEEGRNQ
jgi:alkylation response protein AidB-like acyl-CoA dehydrogenase